MKTLYIMRHAKSDRRHFHGPDIERPLNDRGERDAPRMGRALSSIVDDCDVALSPAVRVAQTWAGLCDGWPALSSVEPVVDDALYTFDDDDVMHWLMQYHCRNQQGLWLIGHNPALTDLINRLAGYPAIDNLPTAGFVQLSLAIDHWQNIEDGCGTIETALLPKQLDSP